MNQSIRDRDIENIMGNLLRIGILTSVVIVFLGALLYLFQHGREHPNYQKFIGEPRRFTEFKSIWQTALQGRGRSIIQLGLLILIATPIARIVFSIIGFFLEKDFLYLFITLIVLTIISFSLLT